MCSSFPGRLGEGGPAHREIAVPWRVGAEAESSAEERGGAPRGRLRQGTAHPPHTC